jgi:hypothetical protein
MGTREGGKSKGRGGEEKENCDGTNNSKAQQMEELKGRPGVSRNVKL